MRKTEIVQSVLDVLFKAKRPLSVPDIQRLLRDQNLRPHKTTLYRLLDRLLSENRVQVVLLDTRVLYYELNTSHHHHFRCQSCQAIECVHDADFENSIKTLQDTLAHRGLVMKDHHFSCEGLCSDCS